MTNYCSNQRRLKALININNTSYRKITCLVTFLFRCGNASDYGSVRFMSGFLQVIPEGSEQ